MEPKKTSKKEAKNTKEADDRVMKDVVAPPRERMAAKDLFPGNSKLPDIKALREHLLKEGRLEEKVYLEVVRRAKDMLRNEPNVLHLKVPITVCGDIHGQFFDLDRLFGGEYGGDPNTSTYLFLGDYVDRGCFSTEVVIYLFCMKLCFGKSFSMLRGNHECRQLTAHFNFKDECLYKYSETVYDAVMEAFDCLPLAAVVTSGEGENEQSFFCVHGGLSPDITSIVEIDDIHRFKETPRDGPMCDLLWSDPCDDDKKAAQEDSDSEEATETDWFSYNQTRQCSYLYGVEAVKQFLEENNVTSIIRAHEAQGEGFKIHMREGGAAPKVITIFSAPNYCDIYGNKGAILRLSDGALGIKQFREVPHPYYLPNFMDVFEWSLPFVAEKVTDMLAAVIECPSDEEEEDSQAKKSLQARGGLLKKKVMAVSKILRMFRVLREERENLASLKQLTPNKKIPLGLLRQGPAAIRRAINGFDAAKKADLPNDAHPATKPPTKAQRRRSRRFSRSGRSGSGIMHKTQRSNSELAIMIGENLQFDAKTSAPTSPTPESTKANERKM
uniref:Serine/threonine-protein phosphatase n=1 Tax=Amorphochlora amoebiformis TaxID=1561963 RepID=A0A7S0D6J5_9EUKA